MAVGPAVKVFSRTEREEGVIVEDEDQVVVASEEVACGYVLKRELTLAEPALDVLWLAGNLIVCMKSAVCVLDRDGKELSRWALPEPYSPLCATACERRGDRPQELAVLDTQGNIHFYT